MRTDVEEYFEVFKNNLEEKSRYIEQMRAIKHDTQAHLIVLRHYLETGMYEDARAYLKKLQDVQMSVNMEVEADTGNSLLNAIVEEYISRDKEIYFGCEGKFPEKTILSDYELCVIFSNLMSNAVEASGRVVSYPKEINMKLGIADKQFKIVLENYIEEDINVQILGNGTTKEDSENHGYGVKNLKKIVEQRKGNIEFEVVENKFCVHINFPIEIE